jgi:hypothetical protein
VTSFLDALFQTPSSSRDKSLQTANDVISKMHEMLTDRDSEIQALKEELRQSRRMVVAREIDFLEDRGRKLRLELQETDRDLLAKKRQLGELDGITYTDVYGDHAAATGSVLPTNLNNSVASLGASASKPPPAVDSSYHDSDHGEFDDAMEDHNDEAFDTVDSVFEALDASLEMKKESRRASVETFLHSDPNSVNVNTGEEDGDVSKEAATPSPEPVPAPEPEPQPQPEKPSIRRHEALAPLFNISDDYDPNCLFAITKSANKNTVVYAGNFLPGSATSLDPDEPCKPYWIMFSNDVDSATGKYPTEDLNYIEKNTAYGVTAAPDPKGRKGHWQCHVASLNDRAFDVYVDEETKLPVAKTTVGGKDGVVIRLVRVQLTDGWIPRVEYVDITGVDDDGELVKERKLP